MSDPYTPRTVCAELPDSVVRRLEQAAQDTGLELNTLITIACLDWLRRHDTQWAALRNSSPQRPPHMSE